MPLTAFDPDTGDVVFPGALVDHPKCRDPNCRADLHLVRRTEERVAHFRHSVHSECPSRDQTRDRDAKCAWHIWWQSQCDDPSMVEVTNQLASGDVRRADIMTRYGWAIEVQHSGIRSKTISARQNHWGGKVLWLIDAASTDRSVDFSIDARSARLSALWVRHLTTLVAVDWDDKVYVLPPQVSRDTDEIRADARHVRVLTHQDFIDGWINADAAPFGAPLDTDWYRSARRQRAAAEEQRRAREEEAALRAAREAVNKYLCEYTGPDRDKLIISDAQPLATPAQETPATPVQPLPAVAPPVDDPRPSDAPPAFDVVVDIRDRPAAPDWRKTGSSRHPVTKLPASSFMRATCGDCSRLRDHVAGRLKCDAFWTPSSATDINPTWAACSVWTPARKDTA